MSGAAPRQIALGDVPIVGLTNTNLADRAPEILAMHGWQRQAKDFDFLLATDLPTVAIDLPGFGQTALPSSEWGSPEYADAVAAALDSRGWRDLVVVGHSFGGRVGVHLAARRPDLVRGLVFTGAPLIRAVTAPGRKPPAAYRLARWLNKVGILPDAVMEKQRQKHGSADYRAAGPQLRPVFVRAVNETYDDVLATVGASGVPVALVWGSGDTAAPTRQVDRLREILNPVQVTIGEGKGHDTVTEMHDELVAAVRAVSEAGRGKAE